MMARFSHSYTSHRLSLRKEVFKSWEIDVPIAIVMVIAARGISDYVDSALTGVMVCNRWTGLVRDKRSHVKSEQDRANEIRIKDCLGEAGGVNAAA